MSSDAMTAPDYGLYEFGLGHHVVQRSSTAWTVEVAVRH
jgi:hypothetical protein